MIDGNEIIGRERKRERKNSRRECSGGGREGGRLSDGYFCDIETSVSYLGL